MPNLVRRMLRRQRLVALSVALTLSPVECCLLSDSVQQALPRG